jgi:hypothetical protein
MKRLFLHILFLSFSLYNGCLHASSSYKVSRLANKMFIAYLNNDQNVINKYSLAINFLNPKESECFKYLMKELVNKDEILDELKNNQDSNILIDQEENERNIAIIYNELHKLDEQNSSLSFFQKWANSIDQKLRKPIYDSDLILDENPSSMRLRILGLADHVSQEKNILLKEERLRKLGYKAPEYSHKAIEDSLKKLNHI